MSIKNLLTVCIFVFTSNYAQMWNPYIEHISNERGLSLSAVNDIVQDSTGYFWIATDDGLNRFDGYEFVQYTFIPGNQSGLMSNEITALEVDKHNSLWIGTDGTGIYRLNRDKNNFTNFRNIEGDTNSLGNNFINCLAADTNGNIWIGTDDGLSKFNPGSQIFDRINLLKNDSIDIPIEITALGIDTKNKIWLCDNRGDVSILNSQDNSIEKVIRFQTAFPSLAAYDDIWVGSSNGELIQFPAGDKYKIHSFSKIDAAINSISRYNNEQLLLGTADGLYLYEIENESLIEVIGNEHSEITLGDFTINCLLVDRERTIWAGSYENGIGIINQYKQNFENISLGPLENEIHDIFAILEDSEDNLWIGTFSGLLRIDRENNFHLYKNDPGENSISGNHILSIIEDSDKNIWIGTRDNGLNKYNPLTERFEHFNHDPSNPNSISSDFITCFYEDSFGELWIGTFGGGLNKLNKSTNQFIKFLPDPNDSNSISDYDIADIIEDDFGNLWLATNNNGISCFERTSGQFRNFEYKPADNRSVSFNEVNALHIDSEGTLWAGIYGGGLNKYIKSENRFEYYTTNDGLINNSVYSIIEDDNGNFWLSTNSGISMFDQRTESFYNFVNDDGLTINEFNQGAHFKNDDGEIYLGGINGVLKFHPDEIHSYQLDFKPVITKVGLLISDDQKTSQSHLRWNYFINNQLVLPKYSYFVDLQFATITSVIPNKINYAYKIDELNRDWIITGSENRRAIFANLEPGEYTFKLTTVMSNGELSDNETELSIIITPAFYQTVWFYLLILVSVLAVIYAFYRSRIKRIIEMERLRLKIASDLHDEVGSTLTKISMRAEMLSMQTDKNSAVNDLIRISDQSREAVSTMRDIVWSIDTRFDSFKNLTDKIKDAAFEFLGDRGIKIKFDISGIENNLKLPITVRQNLFLIFKESITNIAKHSNASEVKVTMKGLPENFVCIIHDNGTNFSPSDVSSGQGLKNIKMRASKINAVVKFENNEGFQVNLKMPPIK
ncbi:MAG: hypothetical protein K9J16_11550 [Melioribacteraceae bacterium]|nr:hypothetical protein [Melioribacteraceae bacterium]MCF8356205.1 hypothetical protein [Melioribacteraceae bacterium]MCF8395858.1 hypothetical protein [Melioribacteraceae bacterium]MCF8420048.1 hypothetical protein [Melioribacteraceae bacterium]